MRGATPEPSEELTGEQLGDRAQVLGPSEVRILHEMRVSGEAATVAILGERNPPCEQAPHAALVITDRVVEAHARTQISCPPICRKFLGTPSAQHRVSA